MGKRRLRIQESPCETYKLCGGRFSTKWEFVMSGSYELNEECKLVTGLCYLLEGFLPVPLRFVGTSELWSEPSD